METRGYDHHTPAGSTGIGHGKCIIQPRRLSRPFLASTYNTSLIQCFILYWKISSLWVKAIPKITFLVRFFFEGKDIRTALQTTIIAGFWNFPRFPPCETGGEKGGEIQNPVKTTHKAFVLRFLFLKEFGKVKCTPLQLNLICKENIGQRFLLTPVSDIILFFDQSQKAFWLSKISIKVSYMQSFRQIGLKLWKKGAIHNRYPIVVYNVMSNRESKNYTGIHRKETMRLSKNLKDLVEKSPNLISFYLGQELVPPAHLKAQWSHFSKDLNWIKTNQNKWKSMTYFIVLHLKPIPLLC